MSFIRAIRRWRRKRQVQLSGITSQPLRFYVASHVENFRILRYGGEQEILTRFLQLLQPADTVFDVGASVGLYCVATATVVQQGNVYAFEPDPETYAWLRKNVKLNRLRNVHLLNWAVSNQTGEATLYTDGVEGYAPSLVKQEQPNAPAGERRIKTDTLDRQIAQGSLPVPDVLKVDIEGAEQLCLLGSQRLLGNEFGKKPRLIFLELHPLSLPLFGSSIEEVTELILGAGYTIDDRFERNDQIHWFCSDSQRTEQESAHA